MTNPYLYKVKIIYEVMVAAEDYDDAYFVASENVKSITNNEVCHDIEVVETIESIGELSEDWIGVIPYGDNPDELNCYQILELESENKKKEMIESLSDEQKYQLLSTLTITDIVNLIHKKEQ